MGRSTKVAQFQDRCTSWTNTNEWESPDSPPGLLAHHPGGEGEAAGSTWSLLSASVGGIRWQPRGSLPRVAWLRGGAQFFRGIWLEYISFLKCSVLLGCFFLILCLGTAEFGEYLFVLPVDVSHLTFPLLWMGYFFFLFLFLVLLEYNKAIGI